MRTITCKIPERLDAELEAAARSRRVPKSTIVREALEQRLRYRRKLRECTAFDLAKSVCGTVEGPSDLATNPKYLEELGG
ncbi:MAG: ribbon-helix-helix protein, CopG family [Acidobacteria bacterium]|nr:MAG: ribbon-helix-helix protein, CopG family [Acidobacteriota bacterium]